MLPSCTYTARVPRNIIAITSTLCRINVSLMVGATTAFGYVLLRPQLTLALLQVTLATIFLSAACSVWNQVQERTTDAMMERTKNRPVANGTISPCTACCIGLLLCVVAMSLLFTAHGKQLVLLGLAIIAIYNGIYTPLKKVSCFSLLIGAVVGALPIVMGWIAAGGSVQNPLLVLLYGVYLLWQIPHFWLRVERNRADYQKALLPVPSLVFSYGFYQRIFSIWFYAFVATLLMLPAFPFVHSVNTRLAITLIGILVFIVGAISLHGNKQKGTKAFATQPRHNTNTSFLQRSAIAVVDGSMLLVMGCLLLDSIMHIA